MRKITLAVMASASMLLVPSVRATDSVLFDFEDIPVGTTLVDGHYGWYNWGTGGSGQQVIITGIDNQAIAGPGSSSYVSSGLSSIGSLFKSANVVKVEWDLSLSGAGPHVGLGRDLDDDGVLENAIGSPAEQGWEGLFDVRVDTSGVRLRYFTLDEKGVRHQDSEVTEFFGYQIQGSPTECIIQLERLSVTDVLCDFAVLSDGVQLVQSQVTLSFMGPHRWDEIDGFSVRTDTFGSTVDNVLFSTSTPCPADLDGNGQLNFFDVSGFLVFFQLGDLSADFNGDGQLNFFDVSVFLGTYISGCP